MERERLGSRLGFILLSAGCAIGCGNVWKFPWMTGQNGGAAFVIVYIICLILLGIPAVNINGAAIGSVLAYVTAGILNFRALKKYTNVSLDMKSIFFRPLVAALIMGAAAIVSYKLLFLITSSNAVSTLVSVMFAAAVYFVSAFLTGAVTKDEIELIPKGDLIYRLAVRLKVAK